jgi:2-dehydropantoate 2-reductase
MKEIKKVLICGIGAIGSILAHKISDFDNENLKILVDKNRLEAYKKSPKIFNGKELKLNYITPENTEFKADLILIATKFNALNEVIKNIENFVDENTIIMSILNGISSEEILAQKYNWKNIPLAFFLGHSETIAPNNYFYDGRGTVVFGAKENYTNPKIIERIEKYFTQTQINYQIPENINYAYWLKFMLNISTNQPSAILRLTFGEMTSNPDFMNMFNNIMKEVQAIAKAEGVKNTEKMINDALIALKNLMPEGKTSMLQDVEAKRQTEVEMLAGTMIALGKKHKIPTPYNTIMYEMIKSIENNY